MKAIKPALIALCLTTLTGAVAVGCSHKHTFGDWTVEKEATCTEEGLRVRECGCGEKEEEAIPTIAHTFAWAYDAVEHWKACTVCGTEEENSREYHTPIMGTCMDLCGFTMNPIEAMGLEIEEIEVNGEKTGESRVKGIGICKDYPSITIPAYDIATGNPIVEIGDRVFDGSTNHASESGEETSPLEHVEIPRTIRKIGNYAFANNPKLKELTIPDSVTEIGQNAFQALPFEHFEIPRGITKISNAMLADCNKLKEIEIPSNITFVEKFAFLGCTALTKITIPTSVKVVGQYAFDCDSTGYDESDEPYAIPSSLAQVVYLGTLNEWCDIQFGMDSGESYGFNSDYANPLSATDFVKLYIDGQPITSVSFENGLEEILWPSFHGYVSLTSVTFPSSLRKISKEAFKDCVNLTEVSFAEGLEEIGEDAFAYSGITSVTLPASLSVLGVSAFFKCPALETVEIKGGALTTLPSSFTGLFQECPVLTSVTIGEGVQEIGRNAFQKCASLKNLSLPSSLKKIGEAAFQGTAIEHLVIPEGVEEICEDAFYNCKQLSSVTINANAVKIDTYAFCNCTQLDSIDLSNATYIGPRAFYLCEALTEITVPDGAFYLAGNAFEGCSITYTTTEDGYKYLGNWLVEVVNKEITTITIKNGTIGIADNAFNECENVTGVLQLPQSLVYIGTGAFFGLANLTGQLIIPPSVRSIGAAAFADTGFTQLIFGGTSQLETIEDATYSADMGAFEGCLFTAVTLPDSLTHLGGGAFRDCVHLNSVTFGTASKLKTIGGSYYGGAFQGCTGLAHMNLPEGIETIGDNLFEGCTGLQDVVIPDTVETLDDSAFEGCASLTKVTLPGLEKIAFDTFSGCSHLMEIEYHGTNEKWDNAVANNSGWAASLPEGYHITFTK